MKYFLANWINCQAQVESIEIQMQIFDIRGKHFETRFHGMVKPGIQSLEWNANGLPSGLYFIHFTAGNFSQN